jgi:quinoprotein glucose dehydrogenase
MLFPFDTTFVVPMTARALHLLICLLCNCVAEAASKEWPVYGGNYGGTKYSPLTQINRTNVTRLKPALIYRCDDMRERPATTIQCNPLIIGGVIYLTTPGLKLVALKAATGEEIWRFDPWNGAGGRGVNRGVAYWESDAEQRLFFSAGTFLYAIDARTGKLIPSFGAEGRIDLRDGLDRDVFFLSVTATSPGVVYKDLLIMGSTVGEGPAPAAPGHIRAFDVRTGKRRWIFHTIPHPGEVGYETWPPDAWKTIGGANAWGGLTLDLERGIVFAGTGSASYDHFGGNRKGMNLLLIAFLLSMRGPESAFGISKRYTTTFGIMISPALLSWSQLSRTGRQSMPLPKAPRWAISLF